MFLSELESKHDSRTATTHAADFEAVFHLGGFKEVICNSAGYVKPIVIITVDGGPDNSGSTTSMHSLLPVMHQAIVHTMLSKGIWHHYLMTSWDLFCHMITMDHTLIPMAKLDSDLEKANFKKVGETLAEVWNQTVIGDYSVHVKYVEPEVSSNAPDLPISSQQWCCNHVQQSQYCLQIVKCNTLTCCGQRCTNYNEVFHKRFIPLPMPFYRTCSGISSASCADSSDTY